MHSGNRYVYQLVYYAERMCTCHRLLHTAKQCFIGQAPLPVTFLRTFFQGKPSVEINLTGIRATQMRRSAYFHFLSFVCAAIDESKLSRFIPSPSSFFRRTLKYIFVNSRVYYVVDHSSVVELQRLSVLTDLKRERERERE